ncbi:helix-turn-helix domain-containing protein [Rubritalea tangerina]|uniref:Helix-turn-helix domain-containing protein n=1 Tax=Rubritalea tangerina TaxID=430798 RepID=A0ABW4ZBD1_9BACT
MHDDAFFQKYDLGGVMCEVFDDLPGFLYFVKDCDLRLVAINRRLAEKIAVVDKQSIIGMTDYDYLPSHMADAYKEDDLWVLETGKSIRGKVELVTSGKGLVDWSRTTKTPLRDAKGEIVGIIGVTRPFERGVSGREAKEVLGAALQLMHDSFHENVPISRLAKVSHLSVSSFVRRFKKHFDMTPKEYMRHLRVQEACHMLVQTTKTLAEIGADCGYSDQSHFSREFSRVMKESPKQYRGRF